jgi:hypothetical protein
MTVVEPYSSMTAGPASAKPRLERITIKNFRVEPTAGVTDVNPA